MKSVGSQNSQRGHKVEGIISDRYGGTLSGLSGYDFELNGILVEVKSCLSWHTTRDKGKPYSAEARVRIEIDEHEDLKKIADSQNKKAVYAFVKIPRYPDGKAEKNPVEWTEAWSKWEDVDSLVKDPKKVGTSENTTAIDGRKRKYYNVKLRFIFGK